jgi:hypothetical protein
MHWQVILMHRATREQATDDDVMRFLLENKLVLWYETTSECALCLSIFTMYLI